MGSTPSMKRILFCSLILSACPETGPPLDEVQLKLDETELPGVFQVTTLGIDLAQPLRFACEDNREGTATLVEGLWLGARDRYEVTTRCSLKGTTEGGESYESAQVNLRSGMLEAQRSLLDPPGDSGLDTWETKALAEVLNGPLPEGVERLAWVNTARQLVVRTTEGRGTWARRWTDEGLRYEQVELEGTDPCGNDAPPEETMDAWTTSTRPIEGSSLGPDEGYEGSEDPRLRVQKTTYTTPMCVDKLFAFFDNPEAPDLLALPHPAARQNSQHGQHGDLSALSSQAAFLAWGAGITPGTRDRETQLKAVDLAPTLAAALNLGTTLGRTQDGTLAVTQLKRQDGVIRSELIASGTTKQVLVLVIEGLGATALARIIERSTGLKRMRDEGLWLPKGIAAGFPSNAMPGQNTLGSGVWPGHHGLDNDRIFSRRDEAIVTSKTSALANNTRITAGKSVNVNRVGVTKHASAAPARSAQ